ncbi:MAG: hypothetical protein CBE43_00220 [Rhodopirellula sp. TMED283]|nr:MAG: hypothetical protein CBE43_00220 [Rhodopirellula sp. TMED283]
MRLCSGDGGIDEAKKHSRISGRSLIIQGSVDGLMVVVDSPLINHPAIFLKAQGDFTVWHSSRNLPLNDSP